MLQALLIGTITLKASNDKEPIAGITSLGADGTTLLFKPTGPLTKNTRYIAATMNVKDLSGSTLQEPPTWSFTTQE